MRWGGVALAALSACGGADTVRVRDGTATLTIDCRARTAHLAVPAPPSNYGGYTTLVLLPAADTVTDPSLPGDSLAARFSRERDPHWRRVADGYVADSVGVVLRAAAQGATLFVSRAPATYHLALRPCAR